MKRICSNTETIVFRPFLPNWTARDLHEHSHLS